MKHLLVYITVVQVLGQSDESQSQGQIEYRDVKLQKVDSSRLSLRGLLDSLLFVDRI